MALDSDEKNADSTLIAKFYNRAIQNNFKSEQEGRPIFEDVDYVTIFTPGDNLNIVDQPVRSDHKARFPVQWAHYQNQKEGDQREIGTPLSAWPRLTPSQIEELKAIKFFTVESIAAASDAALSSIGMVAGVSPFTFRDYAQRFLKVSADDAELHKIEAENKQMRDLMAAQQAQLDELKAQLSEVKKPSKPAKTVTEEAA